MHTKLEHDISQQEQVLIIRLHDWNNSLKCCCGDCNEDEGFEVTEAKLRAEGLHSELQLSRRDSLKEELREGLCHWLHWVLKKFWTRRNRPCSVWGHTIAPEARASYSLSFPSSFCRAPCVFGGASSEDRALYFLCQLAAGIHLPAPRGADKGQHRAHLGGDTAAPPVQDLCHSPLAWTCAVRHRPPTKQSELLLRMYVLSPHNNFCLAYEFLLQKPSFVYSG